MRVHAITKGGEMSYKTQVEEVAGRQVVTVFYDREKDDYLEAIEWSRLNLTGGLTIIFEPR